VSEKGYVFVRGKRDEVEAVKRAVEEISKNLSKEIKLKLSVFLVDVTEGRESGTDFTALLREKDYLSLSFVGLANWGAQTYMSFTAQGADITNFLFKLSKNKGNIKLISTNTFRVLNTQPIYFAPQVKKRIISKYELSYIEVTGTDTGAQPTITVDTEDIESGEKLLLVPYYIGKDKIAIDFVRKYSQIDDIIEKTVNLQGFQNQISLPQITSTVQTGQSVLKKGDSLILVSNTMDIKSLKKEGIPFLQDVPILGSLFSHTTEQNRKFKVVVVITYEGD
jgi:type II secretory pathway component GspD/PulD (secretin)